MLTRAVSHVAAVAAGALVAKRWSSRAVTTMVKSRTSAKRNNVTAVAASGLLGHEPVFAQTMLRVKDPVVGWGKRGVGGGDVQVDTPRMPSNRKIFLDPKNHSHASIRGGGRNDSGSGGDGESVAPPRFLFVP
jgi:hypothetical protein